MAHSGNSWMGAVLNGIDVENKGNVSDELHRDPLKGCCNLRLSQSLMYTGAFNLAHGCGTVSAMEVGHDESTHGDLFLVRWMNCFEDCGA